MLHYLMFIMVQMLCTTGITIFINLQFFTIESITFTKLTMDYKWSSHHLDTRNKFSRPTLIDSSISMVHEPE